MYFSSTLDKFIDLIGSLWHPPLLQRNHYSPIIHSLKHHYLSQEVTIHQGNYYLSWEKFAYEEIHDSSYAIWKRYYSWLERTTHLGKNLYSLENTIHNWKMWLTSKSQKLNSQFIEKESWERETLFS